MRKKRVFGIIFGVLIGVVNGLLGGGGGMLTVPALSMMGLKAKESHATAILVILPISIISSIVYICHSQINSSMLLSSGVGVFVGGAIGAVLLAKLNSRFVRILFAFIMIVVGARQVFG